jgi:hypothetical protein
VQSASSHVTFEGKCAQCSSSPKLTSKYVESVLKDSGLSIAVVRGNDSHANGRLMEFGSYGGADDSPSELHRRERTAATAQSQL